MEAERELGHLVGQVDDVLALSEVEGKERRHPHVVEAQRDIIAPTEKQFTDPGAAVLTDLVVRIHLQDHEAVALTELRIPWNANQAAHVDALSGVALPLEAHEGRAARRGLGPRAATEGDGAA